MSSTEARDVPVTLTAFTAKKSDAVTVLYPSVTIPTRHTNITTVMIPGKKNWLNREGPFCRTRGSAPRLRELRAVTFDFEVVRFDVFLAMSNQAG